jgi:hypothetical protein
MTVSDVYAVGVLVTMLVHVYRAYLVDGRISPETFVIGIGYGLLWPVVLMCFFLVWMLDDLF